MGILVSYRGDINTHPMDGGRIEKKGFRVMTVVEQLQAYLPDPNTIKGGISEVVDVLQREAPEICNEIVNWSIVENGIWCFIPLIICVTASIFLKRSWLWTMKQANTTEGFSILAGIVVPIIAIIWCFTLFLWHIGAFIKPIVAPRLYLLEFFRNLAG